MQQPPKSPAFLDIFLKEKFVLKFFAVLVLVYVAWGSFFYFKTMIEINEASKEFHAKNYAVAYQKILPYAMDGHSESRFQVGVMFALGLGVPKDKMLATSWFECSRISGCVKGQNEYRLAVGCLSGEWGERPKDECLLWMKFSSDHEYAPASQWLDQYNAPKKPQTQP